MLSDLTPKCIDFHSHHIVHCRLSETPGGFWQSIRCFLNYFIECQSLFLPRVITFLSFPKTLNSEQCSRFGRKKGTGIFSRTAEKTCPKPIFSRFFPLFAVQNPGVFSRFFPLLASNLLVFPIILPSSACLENAINTWIAHYYCTKPIGSQQWVVHTYPSRL